VCTLYYDEPTDQQTVDPIILFLQQPLPRQILISSPRKSIPLTILIRVLLLLVESIKNIRIRILLQLPPKLLRLVTSIFVSHTVKMLWIHSVVSQVEALHPVVHHVRRMLGITSLVDRNYVHMRHTFNLYTLVNICYSCSLATRVQDEH
jgi:hypothetical protein